MHCTQQPSPNKAILLTDKSYEILKQVLDRQLNDLCVLFCVFSYVIDLCDTFNFFCIHSTLLW